VKKLKKKLLKILFIFVGGFWAGSYISEGPKGTELVVFIIIASISGFAAGVMITKAIYKYKTWKQDPNTSLKFMGYQIKIGPDQPKELERKKLEVVKESNPKPKTREKAECDLCNGEPVTLSGQKINCPQCKGKTPLAN
jgi:hypothetical protein